jgi:membrane protease YdiL (CAAX protease family)
VGAVRRRWLGTLLYLPLLYGLGWLAVQPLELGGVLRGWRPDQVALLGTLVSFVLLLLTLPARLRRAWGEERPWRSLGVATTLSAGLLAFLRGLQKALVLLALVTAGLLASGHGRWNGSLDAGAALNALLLLLGLGFAEELLFRGWLWGELARLPGGGPPGGPRALVAQAVIFGLVHPWHRVSGPGSLALLGGLFLLGLVLGLERRADGGVLWGAVGLHGGLAGGWFLLRDGLVSVGPAAPAWLIGPGEASPNPIGGLVGWLGLGALLWLLRRCWRVSGPP